MPPSCRCADKRQYRKPWREATPAGALHFVPRESGGVAHAMAAGARVDAAVGVDRDRARRCLLPQMSHRVLVRLPARFVARSCGKDVLGRWPGDSTQPGPPAITHSSLDLCSAPSRRVASLCPPEMCAAAALTAPARRWCLGSCVMASDYRCYQGGVVRTRTRTVDC